MGVATEMAQWFRVLTALPKDWSSVPSTCLCMSYPPVAPEDPVLSSGFHGYTHHAYTKCTKMGPSVF